MTESVLKTWRKSLGMTLREVAERGGISHSFLSQVENENRKPNPNSLKKISVGLGIPYDDLMLMFGYITESGIKNYDNSEIIRFDMELRKENQELKRKLEKIRNIL